ncbi:MAG TPA: DUF4112 domain-containing protein [Pseudolabrys sp.]|nr:DUF4112 domain-containing protein [Pseudolabrys sp.]
MDLQSVNPPMRESVVPRALSAGQAQRLIALRKFAQLLDSALTVPGTKYRIGLDPILGLVPGIGDLVSPLFAIGILWQAHDLGIPRVVQLRMIFNVAIDALLGVVPFVGDLFDFVWKANDKNMALLDDHAAYEYRASAGDRIFVALLTVAVIVIAAVPFVIATWMIAAIRQSFS